MLAHEFLLIQVKQINIILELQKEFGHLRNLRFSKFRPVPTWTNRQEKADAAAISYFEEIYQKNRSSAVQIKDEYILPILDNFVGIDTFLDGCIPYSGIFYYGFTVIAAEKVSEFGKVLQGMWQGQELVVSRVMRKIDSDIWQKSITGGGLTAPGTGEHS